MTARCIGKFQSLLSVYSVRPRSLFTPSIVSAADDRGNNINNAGDGFAYRLALSSRTVLDQFTAMALGGDVAGPGALGQPLPPNSATVTSISHPTTADLLTIKLILVVR